MKHLEKPARVRLGALRPFAIAAAFAAVLASAPLAGAADYTWLGSTSGNWNSDANWSDGTTSGLPWVDDASSPTNAIFGSSSTRTTVTVPSGETRRVGNLTVGDKKHTFSGSGTISVAGTLAANVDATFNTPLASGRADGSLHVTSSNGKIAFLYGRNTQTSTVLESYIWFAPNRDASFGTVPSSPTDNILVTGNVTLFGDCTHGDGNFAINQNRTLRISPGKFIQVGASGTLTFKNLIVANPSSGLDFSTDTYFKVASNWTRLIVLDPGAGRTNAFGRLWVDNSCAKIASGTTLVAGPLQSNGYGYTGGSAPLCVVGNGSSWATDRGYLAIEGGTLYAPQNNVYVDVHSFGQVVVQNGGKIAMPHVEWLNGHNSRGRLTIGTRGEVAVHKFRLSGSGSAASEINLNQGGLLRTTQMYLYSNSQACDFNFNGGVFRLLTNVGSNLFGNPTDSGKWGSVRFRVLAGGAVFDTSDGWNMWWQRPLVSGAANDGGLAKSGSGQLIMTAANAYNGPTSLSGGTVQIRADGGLPAGTKLTLSGCTVDFSDYGSPARLSENWVSRIEGSGTLTHCDNLHVTNAIAPSANATVTFNNTCELRGGYVVSGDASGCGLLRVASGQSISDLRLTLANASALDKHRRYGILETVSGSFSGQFDESALPDGWKVKYTASSAILSYQLPTTILFR